MDVMTMDLSSIIERNVMFKIWVYTL